MRVVGLDIHRVFAEAVMLDGADIVRLGRVGMTREHLVAFARTLTHDDHIVIEATGNAAAVAAALAPHVGRVIIANPRQVRLIAEARVKTWRGSMPAASCRRSGCRMHPPRHCVAKSHDGCRSCGSGLD
jgi:hypothetical protein